jgi:hypothetical protein
MLSRLCYGERLQILFHSFTFPGKNLILFQPILLEALCSYLREAANSVLMQSHSLYLFKSGICGINYCVMAAEGRNSGANKSLVLLGNDR